MEMRFALGPDCRIVLREVRAEILRPEIEELARYALEVVREGAWTVYRGMNQRIDPLFVRVRVSDGEQDLVINGTAIPLRSLAASGARLELRVR
jgi:hypothetical protein